MEFGYTQMAGNAVLSLLDKDSFTIWERIEDEKNENDADLWKNKFSCIAEEYALSSRYALMRIMASRAAKCSVVDADITLFQKSSRYAAKVNGKDEVFSDFTFSHAANLNVQESSLYLDYMLEISYQDTDNDPEQCEYLITRAWYDEESANEAAVHQLPEEIAADPKLLKQARSALVKENKTRFRTRLSRSEALMLGHCLRFSLEEMEWYLLRVFDCGDTFRYNESSDVIDAYGFLVGAGILRVESLKSRYIHKVVGQPRTADYIPGNGWTQSVSDNLPQLISTWRQSPAEMDEDFMQWILRISSRLDRPSQTALRIYRNLAAFASDLLTGEELVPDEEEFEDCIQDVYEDPEESGAARKLYYENNIISEAKCRDVANRLLLENKIQSASEQADNANAWHILTTRNDGKLTASGGINSSRTRVADILLGRVQPEKSDFLYLLWFIENLVWQNADPAEADSIRQRITGFISTADYLLEAAMLPHFYVPHIMEQTMLLSIVQGSKIGEDSAVVYEYALSSFKERRERTSGSVRHDLQTKVKIVTDYIQNAEMTLEQCAAKYCISPKTLSAWQKTLLEKGLV